ncbi:hypothetical protein ACFO5R_11960 [Halosolutus amylolyticus]|uniref:DUF7511 domain-containing protein n=1 Tax=Halosolutus amylolyticus TaxID=2932267 RepID=A0ABD5PQ13_9EURY|nr:hypothetical protein [Halosolutus amylolyticus]
MTSASRESDPDGPGQRGPTAYSHDGRPIDLESVVVRYEDRPDRCTIVPRDCTESSRLTTWLSADIDVFVDLGEHR